jgi:hypothetical protein
VQGGAGDEFEVRLPCRPDGDLTVFVTAAGAFPDALKIKPERLRFSSENWSQPQTVRVNAPTHLTFQGGTIQVGLAADQVTNAGALNPAYLPVQVSTRGGQQTASGSLDFGRGVETGLLAAESVALAAVPAAQREQMRGLLAQARAQYLSSLTATVNRISLEFPSNGGPVTGSYELTTAFNPPVAPGHVQ